MRTPVISKLNDSAIYECPPSEIVLKIWHLTQPNLTLPVVWVNLVEARKFLLLLKTTTLAVYNAALKGKIILYSQLIISIYIHKIKFCPCVFFFESGQFLYLGM